MHVPLPLALLRIEEQDAASLNSVEVQHPGTELTGSTTMLPSSPVQAIARHRPVLFGRSR